MINCGLTGLHRPADTTKVTVPETVNVRWCRCKQATGWEGQQVTARRISSATITSYRGRLWRYLACSANLVFILRGLISAIVTFEHPTCINICLLHQRKS